MPALTYHEIDDELDGYEQAVREHARRVQSAIDRVERDEQLRDHLDALGMPDAEAYRQWCRRQGLSTRLAKSALARDDELDLMRTVDSWRFSIRATFDEKDHRQLVRLRRFARRGAWDEPRRAIEHFVGEYARSIVGPETTARRRYCRLVTAFAAKHAAFRDDENAPEWLVLSLAMLARAANGFARDPENWEPQSRHNFVSALRSFLRHAFVKYETPPSWSELCFFRRGMLTDESVGLYLRIASGFGLAGAKLPFAVSKRAARFALDAPVGCRTFHTALRYGEARAYGAARDRAVAIAQAFDDVGANRVWSTVSQWLAQHLDFPDEGIDDLRHYIYEICECDRWVPDARGRWVMRPIDPNWSIAGRSAAALLRSIAASSLYDEDSNRKRFSDDRPKARPERIRVDSAHGNWLIVPLDSVEEYTEEGTAMGHCVATYFDDAENGELEIYSLRQSVGHRLARRVTICVRPSIGISEARGFANRNPSQKELAVIAEWARRKQIAMKMLEV